MAIILNDNIRINAGKPVDAKYLSSANTPYASVAAVNAAITVPERHIGLTVNILGVEYWYSGGVANGNLIIKVATGGTSANAITGATNIGFYQGFSGVQVLPINHQLDNTYDGDYYSLYNNYYRGTDGKVHIGTPTDGIPKRGYVKTASPVKSWIWNEYTGDGLLGWILMDGNISQKIGQFDNGQTYYNGTTTFPYIQTSWSGTPPPNGSNVVIDAIRGSLTTGATITIGGGVYAQEVNNVLEFKTIQTKSPNTIAISSDEAFVYVSGKTQTGRNIGTGVGIFDSLSGTTLQFKSICGVGGTIVCESGGNILISGGSGGGGGTYDLSSPAAICVGGICCGTILTGKTAFQLFEELLVPELCGTLTPQSGSISSTASATYEIGCSASFSVCGVFSQGSINPQYCSASPFRVGAPTCYIFTGCQIAGAYACTTSPAVQTVSSYPVCAGTQTWTVQTCYSAGVQPLSSKGNPYNSACIAGITPSAALNITGILPWYWGTKASGIITGSDVAAGTKTVAAAGASTPITFNASSPVYLWFAAPAGTTPKTKWWVCAANAGNVGGTGNLWASSCSVTVNSAQSCWTGCLFDVYVTCYPTTTAMGIPMCLYY